MTRKNIMEWKHLPIGSIVISYIHNTIVGVLEKIEPVPSSITCDTCKMNEWNAHNGYCRVHVCPDEPVHKQTKYPPNTGYMVFRTTTY